MPTLPKDLRSKLEKAVLDARADAAAGAESALIALGVGDAAKPGHLDDEQAALRRRLRARGRQAGDALRGDSSQETDHLVQECAYEHWHRMLFARFLAENELLRHPEMGVAVSLEECEELARDEGLDRWELAARFAQHMLPEVFRQDDPVLSLRLSTEASNKLTALLAALPSAVFSADDSLGWTYQFWQTKRKKEVNDSGVKIGADEISPVTQLFTEDYMVEFLLHNTLGAWHAARCAAISNLKFQIPNCPTEDAARRAASLPPKDGLPGIDWTYLRFVKVKVAEASSLSSSEATSLEGSSTGSSTFFNPEADIDELSGNLPHWRQSGVTYFVTFRCADSLPQEKLRQWNEEREIWMDANPEPHTEEQKHDYYERFPKRIQNWLDVGHGECLLRNPEKRRIVENALRHFDGERYQLGEFVVAANHVHVLVTPHDGHTLSEVLHSWKSFTANQVNKRTGHDGAFWQQESYDHIVRNERALHAIERYIRGHDKVAVAVAEASSLSSEGNTSLEGSSTGSSSTFIPAAGTFDGWPTRASDITFLDPCMGSGHFPVFALPILARLRMEEEDLSAAKAVHAVLRDNLHGLEIDPRCAQIGAFNLALTAWKLGGYQALPPLHIACCGLAPRAKKDDWVALAGDNDKFRRGMERLYQLFEQAPILGSLINPRLGGGDLLEAGFEELQPLLEEAMAGEAEDDAAHEMAVTARGVAKAAEMLAGKFTLAATNVPYLARGKQSAVLQDYSDNFASNGKMDLATIFLHRCRGFQREHGVSAVVKSAELVISVRLH